MIPEVEYTELNYRNSIPSSDLPHTDYPYGWERNSKGPLHSLLTIVVLLMFTDYISHLSTLSCLGVGTVISKLAKPPGLAGTVLV